MSDSAPAIPLQIDIVSDVVCPWCVIGYKQLQKALAAMPQVFDITVRWQPFELNPQMPPEGQDLREHLQAKYGSSSQQGDAARKRLLEYGESLGFVFDYYEGMRMVNTFRAHQLLHWAAQFGAQTALKTSLFNAFFSQRQNVNDIRVLAKCAQDAGLDDTQAIAVLNDQRYADNVREAQAYWRDRDVYAVPTFFLQQEYQVPGAQEADTFRRLLEKLRKRHCAALTAPDSSSDNG